MNHYFRKTAAFALTGAMLASSIPLLSFAEEDIPEVDDLPAIVEPGETNTDVKPESDETKTTDDNGENKSESNYTSLLTNSDRKEDVTVLEKFVKNLNDASESTYELEIITRNTKHYKIVDIEDKTNITDIVKFVNAVLGVIKNDSQTKLYSGSTKDNPRTTECLCMDGIGGDGWGVIDFRNNYIEILGSVFYTETPSQIMNEIANLSNKYLPGRETVSETRAKLQPKYLQTVDLDNQTMYSSSGSKLAFDLMDKVTCNIVNDKSFYDSLFDTVAKSGETIKCTIEMYWQGSPLAILTLEGSRGTQRLWSRPSTQGQGNTLEFDEPRYIKDNKLVSDRVGANGASGQFVFTGKATANDLKVQYFPQEDLKPSDAVSLTDCNYTQTEYGKESMKKFGGGLCDVLGFTAAEAAEITGKNKEEKDDVDPNFGPKEKPSDNKDKKQGDSKNEKYAESLNSIGLLRGTEKGYELEKTFTREESVTILVRLLGDEAKLNAADYQPVFKDVPSDRWSYAYTMYCHDNGITKGTAADEFSPEADVSADQFVTLVLRLLGYTDATPENAFETAQSLGLVSADDVKEYKASGKFIRDDMVKVVYEALSVKTKQGGKLAENLNVKGVITDKELENILGK